MLLVGKKSLCDRNQPLVVSRDKGNPREHRAKNPDRRYDLRHFKLDGDLIKNEKMCDFLLVNDSLKKAYLIELKGGNIDDAIDQLEAGERVCKSSLEGYIFLYRIVCSKVRTQKLTDKKVRKFKDKYGPRLIIKQGVHNEILG